MILAPLKATVTNSNFSHPPLISQMNNRYKMGPAIRGSKSSRTEKSSSTQVKLPINILKDIWKAKCIGPAYQYFEEDHSITCELKLSAVFGKERVFKSGACSTKNEAKRECQSVLLNDADAMSTLNDYQPLPRTNETTVCRKNWALYTFESVSEGKYVGIQSESITLVTDKTSLDSALNALRQCVAVGFDTESKPTFVVGEVSKGPHVVQLATPDHCYLFGIPDTPKAFDLEVRQGVVEILSSSSIKKVGFGLASDKTFLHAKLGCTLANVCDLSVELKFEGSGGPLGIKRAVKLMYNRDFAKSKSISMSNWSMPLNKLRPNQILYAANDAHAALTIYQTWQLSLSIAAL